MANKVETTQGLIRAFHIGDMIPDTLRKNIDTTKGNVANVTDANYITVAPSPVMQTPSGQIVGSEIDLNAIGKHFNSTLKRELDTDSIQMPDALLGNSVKSTIRDSLNFDNLKNPSFIINVNDFREANLISDSNQLNKLSGAIARATQGAKDNRFVDADDADNLIEITPTDAQQLGGNPCLGGNDAVIGTQSNDTANGGAGNDTIIGAGGDDILQGGAGNDQIGSGGDNDIIMGNGGDDILLGGSGNDLLRGGSGNDMLVGNAGNDILIGDAGSDFLMGSEGADQFILRGDTFTAGAAFSDRILDFKPEEGDIIKIVNLKGVEGMDQILLTSVDVNKDGIADTAILCSCGDVVGVIMNADPSKMNIKDSIFLVSPSDTTLSQIG